MADPVRPLVVIAATEAVGAVVMTVAIAASVTGSDMGVAAAALTVAVWLLIAAGLGMVWLGLYRRRRAARTPFLLAQAFAIGLAALLVGAPAPAVVAIGAVLAVIAGAGAILVLRRDVRESLH